MNQLHSDWQTLLSRARTGCPEALGKLLQASQPFLLLLANDLLSDRLRVKGSASDLVQQTYTDALGAFSDFEGDSPREFACWVRQILVNNARDLARHYQHHKRDINSEFPLEQCPDANVSDEAADPAAWAEREEQAQLLDRALQRLSLDDRELILLHHMHRLDFHQLSSRFGCTVEAIRKRWERAVERWRQEALALGMSV